MRFSGMGSRSATSTTWLPTTSLWHCKMQHVPSKTLGSASPWPVHQPPSTPYRRRRPSAILGETVSWNCRSIICLCIRRFCWTASPTGRQNCFRPILLCLGALPGRTTRTRVRSESALNRTYSNMGRILNGCDRIASSPWPGMLEYYEPW